MVGDHVTAPASRFFIDPTEFSDRRALVMGGTQGMGEAIVRRLVEGGARLRQPALMRAYPRIVGGSEEYHATHRSVRESTEERHGTS